MEKNKNNNVLKIKNLCSPIIHILVEESDNKIIGSILHNMLNVLNATEKNVGTENESSTGA